MEIPVRMRSMANPTEMAMPMDRARLMAFWVMEPLEISSTWRASTRTAGSARTMK